MAHEPPDSSRHGDSGPSADAAAEPTLPQQLPEVASSQRATLDSRNTDVRLAEDETAAAPSFRPPIAAANPDRGIGALAHGEQIDDFIVERVLGKGAFGVVYLARQVSLDRQVALKVGANEGSEGRTMARLEHDYIVQVFSESIDATGRLRLLCMQLVPGASLEGVIHNLHRRDAEGRCGWSGADYLAVVESRAQIHDVLDTTAIRDRELIAGFDCVQTAAWVGGRLAEAIDYAHRQGVLHRDIKPANILVNQYGRPMLADFNISLRAAEDGAPSDTAFGGTLAFMAPEHLDAFSNQNGATVDDVDEQSDVYSLAIVVYELLTGGRPFCEVRRSENRTRFVRDLADARRAAPPPLTDEPPSARKTLLRVTARGLEGQKGDRWRSGAEFAAALDGCREMRTAERDLPAPKWFTKSAWKAPFLWFALLAVGPQIIGSVVNIAYNFAEIVGSLEREQSDLFFSRLVPIYNGLVYPLLVAVGVAVVAPVYRVWRQLHSSQRVSEEAVAEARKRAVALPYWMLGIAAAGWLPGGLVFPWLIDRLLDQPVDGQVYLSFVMSFTLSGLIAVAYSVCGLQILVLQVLYPRLWNDPTSFRQVARSELANTPFRLWLINLLSAVIPLVASVIVLAPPAVAAFRNGERTVTEPIGVRLLLLALILLGIAGFQITSAATRRMSRSYNALIGAQS
ncbi:Serine/threonine-protein kinase PknF [Posidoniimonas polymericola]|uniref:Serine/threonine-protein kinase PknF n=1 Tax=Posidoniimonas polymericola TaxID=2528002 RepID=A0A5C5XV19_9BACT|nr:serine/threonine-protein kinase [Posidoniimonas polymericola]TWT66720.1 Serine/threonine-protein kinase PknF [Posidoniimonas polymericola]